MTQQPAKRGTKPRTQREYYPVTLEHHRFCRERTADLLDQVEIARPLPDLLANAYAMGLEDAVEWYTTRGVDAGALIERKAP